jgi:hypothetical protein
MNKRDWFWAMRIVVLGVAAFAIGAVSPAARPAVAKMVDAGCAACGKIESAPTDPIGGDTCYRVQRPAGVDCFMMASGSRIICIPIGWCTPSIQNPF